MAIVILLGQVERKLINAMLREVIQLLHGSEAIVELG